ncbi:DUF2793 domain-containing protein [Hyphomonas pacifica]|uniref:Uncharacterized protein n=1 Tax=Hyphomonas pacifica TaxID=1280941 RepID=A0A062TX31_9PROT|nr:DUF2793 domain-containing protein [Hyphomonas pacifica]KCZ49341.1 hypothetical protein HY2_02870 [Hyphomonas pacifica]RAN33147.1 hypothetical protein HY3_02035 [Hyphomonas pacifica]
MDHSSHLGLPYLQPSQAQKHVTINESLERLDALVQLSVISRVTDISDVTPTEGDRYLIPDGATGGWAGRQTEIAAWYAGEWIFVTPGAGWQAWVMDEAKRIVFQAGAWAGAAEEAARFGVNIAPDDIRRLSVRSAQSLFTHDGGDHRLVINKNASMDIASLVFQQNYSGRSELSLGADGAFALRTSEDGSSWQSRFSAAPGEKQVCFSGARSGLIDIPDADVATIIPPGSGGFLMLTVVDPDYPQAHHSGILVFDVGTSPGLITLTAGTGLHNAGVSSPGALVGEVSRSSLGVDSSGLHIRNRTGDARTYSYTFLG